MATLKPPSSSSRPELRPPVLESVVLMMVRSSLQENIGSVQPEILWVRALPSLLSKLYFEIRPAQKSIVVVVVLLRPKRTTILAKTSAVLLVVLHISKFCGSSATNRPFFLCVSSWPKLRVCESSEISLSKGRSTSAVVTQTTWECRVSAPPVSAENNKNPSAKRETTHTTVWGFFCHGEGHPDRFRSWSIELKTFSTVSQTSIDSLLSSSSSSHWGKRRAPFPFCLQNLEV